MDLEWMGYVAAGLVFCTFYMRTMLPLRWMAIVSNVAFLAYALPLQLWPIVILHGLLLPLNALRLRQLYCLLASMQAARVQDVDLRHLLPNLAHHVHPAGTILFRKGDLADCAYYIASGEVEIPERGVRLQAGQFFGEVGVFATGRCRTGSAICISDAELYWVGQPDLVSAFYQNPTLALQLVRLLADRLADNAERAMANGLGSRPVVGGELFEARSPEAPLLVMAGLCAGHPRDEGGGDRSPAPRAAKGDRPMTGLASNGDRPNDAGRPMRSGGP